MVRSKFAAFALVAALGGCSASSDKAPTGQVVATINGKEITLPELRAEIGPLPANLTREQRAEIESNAMQLLVVRQLLADEAKKRNLDKTPLAAIFRRRSETVALADLMQSQLRQNIPVPSREEAQLYVTDHPANFARRTVYVVDQLIAQGAPAAVTKAMEPLNTMDEIVALLNSNRVPFTATVGVIDTLNITPGSADRIAQLPPNAIFVSPEGPVTRVNRIKEARLSPVLGEQAILLAQQQLQSQRVTELLQKQVDVIVQAGMPKVKINEAFKGRSEAAQAGAATGPSGAPK
jgi:EpsD family peptidyl-prolyl cis-trans isomerase